MNSQSSMLDSESFNRRPKLIVCADPSSVAETAAGMVIDLVKQKPRCILGLATGSSPIGLYQRLIAEHRQHGLAFSSVRSFNLDEYVGLAPDHPQSFRYFMQHELFDHIDIVSSQTHVPDGTAEDVEKHCEQYEQEILSAGGIDLQILGLGSNGHIAFNEPGSLRHSRTRQVQLTEATIQANARFFDSIEQVPKTAITMGIGTILEARKIVLVATGTKKSEAVSQAIGGPIGPACPATFLRTHPDVTFVLDEQAASELT